MLAVLPKEIKEDQNGAHQLSGCGNDHPRWGNYWSWGTNVRSDVIRGEPNCEAWFQDNVRNLLIKDRGDYEKKLDDVEDLLEHFSGLSKSIVIAFFPLHQCLRLLPLSWFNLKSILSIEIIELNSNVGNFYAYVMISATFTFGAF